MRWHLLLAIGLPLLLLSSILARPPRSSEARADGSDGVSPPLASAEDRGEESTIRIHSEPSLEVAADPFDWRTPEGAGGLVPVEMDIPKDITVLGIVIMENGYSVAAIQLPGGEEIYYVSEGDEVPIFVDKTTTGPARPSAAGVQASSNVFYLKIKSITPQFVEVHPARRPDNVQFLR